MKIPLRTLCCFLLIISIITISSGTKRGSKAEKEQSRSQREASKCLKCTEEDGLTLDECIEQDKHESCSKDGCRSEFINTEEGILIFTSQCQRYSACSQDSASQADKNQCNRSPVVVTDRCIYCCQSKDVNEDGYCAPPGPSNPPPIPNFGEYGCTDDEVAFNGYCYRFETTKLTFHHSREWCADNGYTLTSILSQRELEFLKSEVEDKSNIAWWVGAHVRDISLPALMDENWRWVDLHEWKWDLVDIFHPNSPNSENEDEYCGAMKRTNDNYNFLLDDQQCTHLHPFICRRGDGSPLADRWAVHHNLWRDRTNDCKCYTWGDPHYISFDGKLRHYQGNCTYVHLVDRKHNPALFSVNVKTQHPYEGSTASMVHHVIVKVHNLRITLNRGKVVWVNDYPVTLPHTPYGGVHIQISGRHVLLTSSYGFWVKYDGMYRLVIGVSRGYEGHTQGVCGTCDGDVTNDELKPNGQRTRDTNRFINSWNIDGRCPGTSVVEEMCPNDNSNNYKGNHKCGMIKDPSGVFAECHNAVNPAAPFEACLYDMCHGPNEAEKADALCDSLSNYYDMCKEAGIHLPSFRTDNLCPMECPSHSQYSPCMSPCPASCVSSGDCDYSPEHCVEGFECDTNYLLSGSRCVHKLNCGCLDDFFQFHAIGEQWLSPDCRRSCVCNSMNNITCDHRPPCTGHSECVSSKGTRECQCIPGFERDEDDNCVQENYSCDLEDFHYGRDCFKIVNEPVATFEEARILCHNDTYELASILSDDEYDFLREKLELNKYGRNAYWVGANGQEGSEADVVQTNWRWISGDLWTWKLEQIFAEDTPDNVNGDEFCGVLPKEDDYFLNDETCNAEHSFVCRKVGNPVQTRWDTTPMQWTRTKNFCKCYVFGDPHYRTFDGLNVHFQGTCTYTLLMDWAHVDEPLFIVNAKNTLPYEGATVSVVRFVIIRVYGFRIILRRQGEVAVDDVKITLPYNPHPEVFISQSGQYVRVDCPELGLVVQYDGLYKVKVHLARSYGTHARGMCGICDGDKHNDYVRPDGSMAENDRDFGDSWASEESCDPGEEVTPYQSMCPNANLSTFKTAVLCGRITDPIGHLAPCHSVVDPQFFLDSCANDMCNAQDGDEKKEVLCDAIASYFEVCREAGVDMVTFRSAFFCPLPCPQHSVYSVCMSPCPPSCLSPGNCGDAQCVEGCECEHDYILIGRQCVPKSQCGCVDSDGNLHKGGHSWVTSDCKQKCRCRGMDDVRCTKLEDCTSNAQCIGQDGEYACKCEDGYSMNDNGKCIELQINQYDCREQCGGTCRYQTCQSGEIRAVGSCTCLGTILDTCCIDNPQEIDCGSRDGTCLAQCPASKASCISDVDCKCNLSGTKCCIDDEGPLLCEASPCNGQCRTACLNTEVATQTGCTCTGGKSCCIPDPTKLRCEQSCGGFCRDSCDGEATASGDCTCEDAGQMCCKKSAYMRGDPHALTFDGKPFSTQDLCSYILVQDNVNSPPEFKIVATTKERIYITREASNIDSVVIHVNGKLIHLLAKNEVTIDDEVVTLPYLMDDEIYISEFSTDGKHNKIKVTMAFGLNVFWDGKNAVNVDITGRLHGKVAGLFGNADDVKQDELLKKDGTIASSLEDFIDSWTVEGSCKERETWYIES
ncbi:zonadhesin-like [Glandiceps talaboti]